MKVLSGAEWSVFWGGGAEGKSSQVQNGVILCLVTYGEILAGVLGRVQGCLVLNESGLRLRSHPWTTLLLCSPECTNPMQQSTVALM